MSSTHNHPRAVYEILVEGELDQSWQQWFNGLMVALRSASDQVPVTSLTARVVDQSALRGMLCKLWDLNLTLISVRRIEEEDEEREK
jgi:hypothetical protein